MGEITMIIECKKRVEGYKPVKGKGRGDKNEV